MSKTGVNSTETVGESVRREQARELIQTLRTRGRPIVLMGDFNTGWKQDKSTLNFITEELSLKVYDPTGDGLVTFPKRNTRIDWILISDRLRFVSYRVLADVVSDHRVVLAELALNNDG